MTDAPVNSDGSKTLVLAVSLGSGAQLGLVGAVVADVATLLGAGAALDGNPRGSRSPYGSHSVPNRPSESSADSYFGGMDRRRARAKPQFEIPDHVFRLERVTFENPAVITGILTSFAGMGIPAILRIVRDWKTDRQIQMARAEDATHKQTQGARLREAIVDRLLDEIGAASPSQVGAIVGASVDAIDRLMGAGLEVRGLDDAPEPPPTLGA